jgi:sirohydrochlorin cobaltochelatase
MLKNISTPPRSAPNSLNENLAQSALIIVGHGSTVNPDSSAPSLVHARTIRDKDIFAEVAVCFWKEEPGFREVLRMVDSEMVYVVPNFISEGYFTQTVIPRELGLTGKTTRFGNRIVHYCEPAGNHEAMTSLLMKQARAVAPGIPPNQTSLFIVGHGTGLNENSAVAAKLQVTKISETGDYAEVLSAYMEEAPLISDWDKLASQQNVVVVPFFISDGLHSYQDIPVLLGIAEDVGSRRQPESGFPEQSVSLARSPAVLQRTPSDRSRFCRCHTGSGALLCGVVEIPHLNFVARFAACANLCRLLPHYDYSIRLLLPFRDHPACGSSRARGFDKFLRHLASRQKLADAPVSFAKLIGMRLRRVPMGLIVDSRITAVKAGLNLDSDPLEAHYLAGGNVSHVVLALIAADKAALQLDFNRACAIDLAIKGTSKTVLEAVRTSINPKVIDCPNPATGKVTIDAVARDGIGVKVRARVTVRSNLNRFVGGATEDTIIARVGEGIITSIGSAVSYKDVFENPQPHFQDGPCQGARYRHGF